MKLNWRSIRKAERLLRNTHQTIAIVSRGAQKADRNQNALGAAWDELRSLFRMVKGWASGRYREVPWKTVVLSTGAILYFLDPIDIVPDVIPMLGFIDDIAVLRWVIGGIQADLSKFRDWEGSRVEVEAGNLVP
jgi:uncharacterized membrane protein YkvA (DUF1232 family)